MNEPSAQQKADIALDHIDAEADRWAEEVDLVSMIKAAASPTRLNRSAPDAIRERFIARMEAQFDAIIRQAYIEGAFRMMDRMHEEAKQRGIDLRGRASPQPQPEAER